MSVVGSMDSARGSHLVEQNHAHGDCHPDGDVKVRLHPLLPGGELPRHGSLSSRRCQIVSLREGAGRRVSQPSPRARAGCRACRGGIDAGLQTGLAGDALTTSPGESSGGSAEHASHVVTGEGGPAVIAYTRVLSTRV